MRKRRILCRALFIICTSFLLTGCWDRAELEDKAYVIGMGLDPSKKEGKIKVTLLIANPEVGSMEGASSEEKPQGIITFDANDFLTAKGTANAVISRTISYDLLKIIIVSEDLAKEAKLLTFLYDTLKDREIRMDSYIAVSKEKAHQYFLNNQPQMETRPHKYFQFMIDHGTENGLIPDSTLFRFFKAVEDESDLFLAMYTTTEREEDPKIKGGDEYKAGELNIHGDIEDTQFIGSAVFKNGKMIGTLNGQETRIVNTLDETTNISDILINTPDFFSEKKEQMAFRLLKTDKNKVKINVREPTVKIDITVPLSVEVISNPSMVNLKLEKNQRKLKEELSRILTERINDVFTKSQEKLKGAPFPLSYYARKDFTTVQQFERFQWPKKFVEADINVKVDVDIVDYGRILKKSKELVD